MKYVSWPVQIHEYAFPIFSSYRQKSYSQHLVSMHYMNGPMEYVVEFLIYYVGTYLRQELLDDPKVETEMPKFICTRKYPQDGAN